MGQSHFQSGDVCLPHAVQNLWQGLAALLLRFQDMVKKARQAWIPSGYTALILSSSRSCLYSLYMVILILLPLHHAYLLISVPLSHSDAFKYRHIFNGCIYRHTTAAAIYFTRGSKPPLSRRKVHFPFKLVQM